MAIDVKKVSISEDKKEDRFRWMCRTKMANIKQLGEKVKQKKKKNLKNIFYI